MRTLDYDSRPLQYVEVHLTDAEAQRAIEALADCRHDLAEIGMGGSHVPISDGHRDVVFYVYASQEALDAEVAERMRDAT
jgi:hypothetical protein